MAAQALVSGRNERDRDRDRERQTERTRHRDRERERDVETERGRSYSAYFLSHNVPPQSETHMEKRAKR